MVINSEVSATNETLLSFISSRVIVVVMMELFTIFIALSIALTFMLPPCACVPVLAQIPHQQDHLQHAAPALPRKLKLQEEANVKTVGNKHYYMPYKMQEEALPDKSHQKEAKMVHARKGTRREWMEGADTSQFFTMDYSPVRKRRPIHNMFVPVAP